MNTDNGQNGDITTNHGFSYNYFAHVTFVAAMLEDLPQILPRLAFIIAMEEEDGWAITGAMASLTVSVADAMFRFGFPVLLRRVIRQHHD